MRHVRRERSDRASGRLVSGSECANNGPSAPVALTDRPRQGARAAATNETGRRTMATWTPDPTFYPSPRLAARAPAEKLAYVVAVRSRRASSPTPRRGRRRSRARRATARSSARPRSARRRRAAPLRLERLQLVPVPERAASARRAALPDRAGAALLATSTSSTPSPIPRSRRWSGRSRRRRSPSAPATRGRTPSIAGRTASTSARSATPRARARAACS